ncbi:hypothetical protein [Roseateles paludis]|jgi:hypothetical protein|uniref:Uncharacterized protein n=1 Tax=Roseateles paludis TaxID=3145238 RepID=A0ABV0FW70_9BURK
MLRLDLWNYFLAIESDLAACQRFVAFEQSNLSTHSLEFAKVILLAGSETDSVLKELTGELCAGSKASKLPAYETVIADRLPFFKLLEIDVKGTELRLHPWVEWSAASGPTWWSHSYNKLKHQRSASFKTATLDNALNAVAGLYVALLHLHHRKLPLHTRRLMVSGTSLMAPRNHPDDTMFDYAFAGSPFDAFEPGSDA